MASNSTPPTRIQGNLSSMPIEIKKMITDWVYHEHTYQGQQTDSDSTIHRLRPKLQPRDSHFCRDIRKLASVDRTFFLLCCPYLYEGFDSESRRWMDMVDKWKLAFEEILKRHSDHLRNLRCRIPKSELEDAGYPWNEDELKDPHWYQEYKSRSEVLLKFSKSCPRLIDLDIDLDPTHFTPTTQGLETSDPTNQLDAPTSSDHNHMQNLSVQTISQLTLLTHLSLSSHLTRRYYTETFLVDIISNMSLLQSFSCSRIQAVALKSLNDIKDGQYQQSPLGLHLASLTHLVELDLERAQCVDASWNQLPWKSSLKVLALEHCDRVSVSVLHEFLKLFESTLITLTLINVPYHDGTLNSDSILNNLTRNEFWFDFPKLTRLGISGPLPVGFLRVFQPSDNVSLISLDDTPCYEYEDLEQLIKDQLWPNLKQLQITDQTARLYPGEGEDLEDLCQQYGVKLNFDDGDYEGTEDIQDSDIWEWGIDHRLDPDEIHRLWESIARMIRRYR